jgi:hypothetical protein
LQSKNWRGVRVVEGARLESVYTPKVYRGFESLPLRTVHEGMRTIGFEPERSGAHEANAK